MLHHLSAAPAMPEQLPIGPDKAWLAPLAGYSDLPFRMLCREYGASCCVTEMVSAKGLHYGGENTWQILKTDKADSPVVVQLFGAEAPFLQAAVVSLRKRGYQWFDLNMGCSVPKVAKQGAGSAMLRNPSNAIACVKAMVDAALPGHISAKLRLGITRESENWLDIAHGLEDIGLGLITLHPRTARDGFSGQARWEELSRAKRELHIPVLASGDLFSAQDGIRCLEETGVDGVMYARGALTNPAIFRQHNDLIHGKEAHLLSNKELKAMIRRHMELIRYCGTEQNALFRLRSIVPRYVRTLPGVRQLRQRLCVCSSFEELDSILEESLRDDMTLPYPLTTL